MRGITPRTGKETIGGWSRNGTAFAYQQRPSRAVVPETRGSRSYRPRQPARGAACGTSPGILRMSCIDIEHARGKDGRAGA